MSHGVFIFRILEEIDLCYNAIALYNKAVWACFEES